MIVTNNSGDEKIDQSYLCACDARPDAGILFKPTRDGDNHNASDYYNGKCSGEPDGAAHRLPGQ